MELLVVIALLGLLMSVLLPSLRQAKLKAKILATHAELWQVGLGLECYFLDNKEYPPTREDCGTGMLGAHLFQLPEELGAGGYLPATGLQEAMSTTMEDRFHAGHTYKYRGVGECVRDRGMINKWIKSRLWVPEGFPATSSLDEERGQWFDEPDTSPVAWVIFSVGPGFDEEALREEAGGRYPVPRETWYHPDHKKGLLVRIRLKDGREIGTFEKFSLQ